MSSPTRKSISRVPVAAGIRSGIATPASSVYSAASRRRVAEKKCNSLNSSRNASMNSLQLNEAIKLSESMKTVAVDGDKEKPLLPRSVVVKNMRLMAKKKREFVHMQKALNRQQNTFIELYAQMRELEARYGTAGEEVGDVHLVSVTGWPAHDLLLLVRDRAYIYEHAEVNGVIGPAVLKELKNEMSTIPEEVLNMGADLMARRLEILDYLRTRQRVERCSNNHEWKSKNTEFDKETEHLHRLVVDTAKAFEAKVFHCLNLAKTSWLDREAIVKKADRLQKDLIICQNKLTQLENVAEKPNDMQGDKPVAVTKTTSITKLLEALNKERAARESLKHVVSSAEGMLRTARARITVLERQLKDTRAQLSESIRRHKEYELLRRHRETSYDVRSKRLLEVSKNGEVTIEMLSLQRDALELRVKELQDHAKMLEADFAARDAEQKALLESLQGKVAEQEKHKKHKESRVQDLENRVKELQEQYDALKESSEGLLNVDERCLKYLPQKETEPSQKETELWQELQGTKMKLQRVSEELRQSREDKESLLNSLSRIAQEGPIENKMANELVNREQKIFNLQRIIEDLKTTIKSMEESASQKDNQLKSLKMEVGQLRTYDGYVAKNPPTQDLTLEILDLSSQVAALKRERSNLVSAVASRSLMLERHERCADLFAQITRARRELAAHLQGRSEHQLAQGPLIEVNLSASLSSVFKSAAETWTELRTERERVIKLQNMVMSQNVQLQRECHVRTQLEHRRAILERIFLSRSNPKANQPIPLSLERSSLSSRLPFSALGEEQFEAN